MKRKGLPLWLGITIVVVVMIAVIALLVFETAKNGWKPDSDTVTRAGIILAGLLLTLVKLLTRTGGRSLSVYESAYKDEIGTAFSRPESKKYKKKLLKALELYNENRFSAAIKSLRALEKNCSSRDDYCAVLFFIALCCSDSGMTYDAIEAYVTLLKYDETRSLAWSNLGILYKKIGKNDEAMKCYQNAVKYDENNAYAWNNLAQSYLTACEWEKVIAPAERSLELKANMYQADTALTVALYALGKTEESKKHFDRAVMNGANANNIIAVLHSIEAGESPFGD